MSNAKKNRAKVVLAEHIVEVFDIHIKYHPHEKLNKTKRDLIRKRLRDGYSVDDLAMAILGIHNTPHNLGENERRTKYLGLHVSMRSENVDRFIEVGEEVFEKRKAAALSKNKRASILKKQSASHRHVEVSASQKERELEEFRRYRKEQGV
jgi:hypothetical protein